MEHDMSRPAVTEILGFSVSSFGYANLTSPALQHPSTVPKLFPSAFE